MLVQNIDDIACLSEQKPLLWKEVKSGLDKNCYVLAGIGKDESCEKSINFYILMVVWKNMLLFIFISNYAKHTMSYFDQL